MFSPVRRGRRLIPGLARSIRLIALVIGTVVVLAGCSSSDATVESGADENPTEAPSATSAPAQPDPTATAVAVPTEDAPPAAATATEAELEEAGAADPDQVEFLLGMLAGFGLDMSADEEACISDRGGALEPTALEDQFRVVVEDCLEGDVGVRMATGFIDVALTDENGFTSDERVCMSEGVGGIMGDAMFGSEMTEAEMDFGFDVAAANCGVLGRALAMDGIVADDDAACLDEEALANPPTAPLAGDETTIDPYKDACDLP